MADQEPSIMRALDDAYRLVCALWIPVATSALHIYHSALLLVPQCQLIKSFVRRMGATAQSLSAKRVRWGWCLQVLEGHDGADLLSLLRIASYF
jgi:hypothetical protein